MVSKDDCNNRKRSSTAGCRLTFDSAPAKSLKNLKLQVVQRTAHSQTGAVEHMGVDHSRGYIGMAQQFLDRTDIGTVRQQMGGKGVTQSVGRHPLGEIGSPCRLADGILQGGVLDMMAPPDAAARVNRQLP